MFCGLQATGAEEGEDQAEGPAHAHDPNAQPAPSVSARLRDAAVNVADQVGSRGLLHLALQSVVLINDINCILQKATAMLMH